MVQRKKTGKGLAPIEFGKNLPTTSKYAEQLAADAQEQAAREHGAATYISTQGGAFSFDGADLPDTIRVVILHSAFENSWYNNEKWDPDNVEPPYCAAVGTLEDDLVPHAHSVDPQCQNCEECSQNVFRTADNGKGKACGNRRRLALLSISDPDADITEAVLREESIAFMRIPSTSLRNYRDYVKKLSVAGLPPYAAVTDITITPDKANQFEITFEPMFNLAGDDALMDAVVARQEECATDVLTPFEKREAPAKGKKAVKPKRKIAPNKSAPGRPGR